MDWPQPLPSMDIVIDECGVPTQELCVKCRARGRFYFINEIIYEEATVMNPRESFRVCPRCDVEPGLFD